MSVLITVSLAICILLVGCGFKSRNQSELPRDLNTLHVKSHDPYGPLTKQLTHRFIALGMNLATSQNDAPYTFDLLSEKIDQRENAISANNQVREYTLSYRLVYQITDSANQSLTGRQTIITTRNYISNTNQVLGSSHEKEATLAGMREDVILQVINRLKAPRTLEQLHAASKANKKLKT